ncbi:Hypothetical_protein [Hexamita inflata]|uniref:Hypothetical_protein n=1 Tax=Hexamita inflata TaxID=28002 RepID=A0AA86RSC4_9EUKA|nr:Hypothetical protein HINF_LOCUS64777 [Hexamita inflata]
MLTWSAFENLVLEWIFKNKSQGIVYCIVANVITKLTTSKASKRGIMDICSNSMKKSFRSQKQTTRATKGSQQNQSKKNQIKELVKSFNKSEMNNCFDRKQQNKNNDALQEKLKKILGTKRTSLSKQLKKQIEEEKN